MESKGLLRWFRDLRPKESRRFWIGLILSVLGSMLIERNWDSLAGGAAGQTGLAVSSAGGMYQQLVTAGPRTGWARYTAIVDIRPGVEPDSVTLLNICNQRRFIAKLLQTIQSAAPSVIVLDKYFGPTTCDSRSIETAALRAAIASTIRAGTPIVVGRRIDQKTLDVAPALSLAAAGLTPTEGFINLHKDTRRLSLRWTGASATG